MNDCLEVNQKMEKKRVVLIVCGLAAALIAGVTEADITTGLIAHWKLDETGGTTAPDNIDSNNGTLIGSSVWTAGAPEGSNPTGALDFPGGTHYVNCGNHSSLNITERRSVAAWIKIDNWCGKWDSIVTKGDIEGNYDLIRAEWTNGIAFYIAGATIAQGTVDVVSDGQWHHAVAVDAKLGYAEINIGTLNPTSQTWTAPYVSDWAVAVGDFD